MIKNYLYSWTEGFREKLAWKIFPEIDMYLEVVKRLAEIDENSRCIKLLKDANSICADKSVEEIRIKYVGLEKIYDDLRAEGFEEPPF